MKFETNLEEIRKNKNMSQEKLAEILGVSRQSISRWEMGSSYPRFENVLMLCNVFNCNMNFITDKLLIVFY